MKARMKQFAVFAVSALLMLLPMSSAMATVVTSSQQPVTINMNITESITLSCTPTTINMTYNATGTSSLGQGTATATGPISCTTAWNLTSHPAQGLYAWFSSSAAGLSNGTVNGNIPTTEIFAAVNGGSPSACNQTPNNIPAPASGITAAFCGNGDGRISNLASIGTNPQTDTILLSMQGLGTLFPGTYTGTLTFFAEAF
jgi:hypothetical protein